MSLYPATDWSGTCGVRLYPGDDFSSGPSAARLTPVAGGAALALDYTWTHPERGEQAGHLVLGRADDAGRVTASLVDSVHQTPGVRLLSGAAGAPSSSGVGTGTGADPVASHPIAGEGLAVDAADEDGGWTVAVRLQGGTLALVLRTAPPPGDEGRRPEPYDVLRAAWRRTEG
ncbi:hypothetical protein [Micrococcus sp.]|uniref:hypothetical protein n=1 Tax=Micrococcus sp. TaxID=1271 RepID=UPI0026DD7823|nr:hypothetical protein [Micrococcus sp.]MDO4239057.1 hypothetical protein [Micrococcus sp.]